MPDAIPQADDFRELCERLVAAAESGAASPLPRARAKSCVVRDGDDEYVVKLLPGGLPAEINGRLSAWKHRLIDRDAACPPSTRRQRIAHFHEAVRAWTDAGFRANVPNLVSRPDDGFIIYRYIEGPSLSHAVTGGDQSRPAETAPIKLVLEHMRERHRAASECRDRAEARSLLHQDPHQLNIIMRDDVPVFVDLEDRLSEGVPLPDLLGRELAIFSDRLLRLAPREQLPEVLDGMMRWYADRDIWQRTAAFLSRPRRMEALRIARRPPRSAFRGELSEAIRARLR